jgi:hypothetical protein
MPTGLEQLLTSFERRYRGKGAGHIPILRDLCEEGDRLLTCTKFGRIGMTIEARGLSTGRTGRRARTGVASETGAGSKQ